MLKAAEQDEGGAGKACLGEPGDPLCSCDITVYKTEAATVLHHLRPRLASPSGYNRAVLNRADTTWDGWKLQPFSPGLQA